jgi:hypothetical protein
VVKLLIKPNIVTIQKEIEKYHENKIHRERFFKVLFDVSLKSVELNKLDPNKRRLSFGDVELRSYG